MSILLFYESIDIDINGMLNSSDEVASYNDTLDFDTSFGANFRAEFDLIDSFNVTGESGDILYSNWSISLPRELVLLLPPPPIPPPPILPLPIPPLPIPPPPTPLSLLSTISTKRASLTPSDSIS